MTAFFLADQTPQDNPLPTAGQCNNLVATKGWPIFIGTPHIELDVGTLALTGMNTAGAAITVNGGASASNQVSPQNLVFHKYAYALGGSL